LRRHSDSAILRVDGEVATRVLDGLSESEWRRSSGVRARARKPFPGRPKKLRSKRSACEPRPLTSGRRRLDATKDPRPPSCRIGSLAVLSFWEAKGVSSDEEPQDGLPGCGRCRRAARGGAVLRRA